MEVLNEILQWTAIIYALWAIWQLGNATRSNIDSLGTVQKWLEDLTKKTKVMENIYSDEDKLSSSMTITNSTGENVYSHGIWHEKSCPVRVSSGALKTCICDKTLTKNQNQ